MLNKVLITIGILLTLAGITMSLTAKAELMYQYVYPDSVYLFDMDRGKECGIVTNNPLIAEAFSLMLGGKISPEEYTHVVKRVNPQYEEKAETTIKACDLPGKYTPQELKAPIEAPERGLSV